MIRLLDIQSDNRGEKPYTSIIYVVLKDLKNMYICFLDKTTLTTEECTYLRSIGCALIEPHGSNYLIPIHDEVVKVTSALTKYKNSHNHNR